MRIGVPKEIKVEEYRVGLTPASVREYVTRGHDVIVEQGAGLGIGASDDVYRSAGAAIVDTATKACDRRHGHQGQGAAADGVVPASRGSNPLHLFAPGAGYGSDQGASASGCTAIAYETVTDAHGGLPLLAPMSEVAARLAIEAAGAALRKSADGMGELIGGVPGVAPSGSRSSEAAWSVRMPPGWRRVSAPTLSSLTARCRACAFLTRCSSGAFARATPTLEAIEEEVTGADVVIGAVLVPGASARNPSPARISPA